MCRRCVDLPFPAINLSAIERRSGTAIESVPLTRPNTGIFRNLGGPISFDDFRPIDSLSLSLPHLPLPLSLADRRTSGLPSAHHPTPSLPLRTHDHADAVDMDFGQNHNAYRLDVARHSGKHKSRDTIIDYETTTRRRRKCWRRRRRRGLQCDIVRIVW